VLGLLAGTSLTMPRSWFRAELAAGRLAARHVRAAAAAAGHPELEAEVLAVLEADDVPDPAPTRMALVTDVRDLGGGPLAGRTWTELVVHQISQHCAAHFDEWQASWAPVARGDLFGTWRVDPSVTHGFRWRHGRERVRALLHSLPTSPSDAIAVMLRDLELDPTVRAAYLTAALASVNGWAAWCAYQRWQVRLAGADVDGRGERDDQIVELLAIRVAWDWLLADDLCDHPATEPAVSTQAVRRWAASWADVHTRVAERRDEQRIDWTLQDAVERAHQDTIIRGLPTVVPPAAPPDVQAVFCIDVRSEVIRRALESVSPTVHTRGFAGFFGLAIAYSPLGGELVRPQLPGLLTPALRVTEATDAGRDDDHDALLSDQRAAALATRDRWSSFRSDPSSVFTFVETMGLTYAAKLVKDSLPHHPHGGHGHDAWEHEGLPAHTAPLRPRLALVHDDPAAAAQLAHRVLTTMGLVDHFAPLVLLCGHGSTTTNNPHASGLDCGACGGNTGEVNARVLASMLDDSAVRSELAGLGISIPDGTWFVAGLHDTTTDTVQLFDTDLVPAGHLARLDQLAEWLRSAGTAARAERAASLGLDRLADHPAALAQRITDRANDWSCVRPEWGLAGNAAFVVAPRQRTRDMNLQGRSFLHDYDHRLDPDLTVLTQIMTAPMVVTNWINLQYHASTVDNRRYGSGNKVLHNVVGGRIGVFEGNGGDLRIGLPIQSLHDGAELRHRPLRLSVFVEAPHDSIATVVARNGVVRDLVGNGWLHLLRIDPDTGAVERWD